MRVTLSLPPVDHLHKNALTSTSGQGVFLFLKFWAGRKNNSKEALFKLTRPLPIGE